MLQISTTKRQTFTVFNLLFILFMGMIFIYFGFMSINSSKIDDGWIIIEGRVISISTKYSSDSNKTLYTPVVQYNINGNNYNVAGRERSSIKPTIGKVYEVAYNPISPSQAKLIEGAGIKILEWSFPLIGTALLIYGPTMYTKSKKRTDMIQNLIIHGIKVQGAVTDIQQLGNDRTKLYKIVVSAADSSGAVRSYISDMITGTPSIILSDLKDNPIVMDVYTDPSNPDNYYVDISKIPTPSAGLIKNLISKARNVNS